MTEAPDTVASGSPDSTHIRAEGSSQVTCLKMAAPRSAWELIVTTVMAMSLIALLIVSFLLHDAYKDIQTQVWLRDDALTKFQQGPYADLKAHVIALEMNCRKER